MGVHSAEGIVQKVNIRLAVNGSGQTDSRSLTTGQRSSALTDDGSITMEQLQIALQGALL